MLTEITFPSRPYDSSSPDSLPPPAWLVGAIITTLIFVGAALLVAIPHKPRIRPGAVPGTEIILHSGIVQVATPTDVANTRTVPFDTNNLSLPIL